MSGFTIRFHPQAWQRDYAIPADPEGPVCWDATPEYLGRLVAKHGERALEQDTLSSDELRLDPAAPDWVKEWRGPFYCEILELDEDWIQA